MTERIQIPPNLRARLDRLVAAWPLSRDETEGSVRRVIEVGVLTAGVAEMERRMLRETEPAKASENIPKVFTGKPGRTRRRA